MHNGRDCAHGRQVGKCDTCDLIDAEQRILELEAQVEQLRNLLIPATKLMRATAPSSGWHKTADEIEAVINSKLITESMNHVDEIKAQAGWAGFVACLQLAQDAGFENVTYHDADAYANQLRQIAKE